MSSPDSSQPKNLVFFLFFCILKVVILPIEHILYLVSVAEHEHALSQNTFIFVFEFKLNADIFVFFNKTRFICKIGKHWNHSCQLLRGSGGIRTRRYSENAYFAWLPLIKSSRFPLSRA